MSDNVWTVPATVLRVISGDTLELRLDLGWRITLESSCRLIGVLAPETETEAGQAARQWVIEKLDLGGPAYVIVTFISHALDRHGHALGQVLVTTPQGASFDLGLELMNAGHAVPMGADQYA